MSDLKHYEGNTSKVMNKLKQMEFWKTGLINDNVKLLNENEKLRRELLNITFRQESSEDYDSNPYQQQ